MKSIQKRRVLGKRLSVLLITMALLALYVSVAPVMAAHKGTGITGVLNGVAPSAPRCNEKCGPTLGPVPLNGPVPEYRWVTVKQVINHKTIKVLVNQKRTCQYYQYYRVCTPMAPCGHTGCAASGSTTKKPVRVTKTCTIWHNV